MGGDELHFNYIVSLFWMLKVVEYSECFYFMAVLVQDYIANGEMEYGEREMIMFK